MTDKTNETPASMGAPTPNVDKPTETACSLKALLAAAPLDDVDISRPVDTGREVVLPEVQR